MFRLKSFNKVLLWACIGFVYPAFGQVESSSADQIKAAIKQRHKLRANSSLKEYPVQSIGPVVQGARIVDIAVHPEQSKTYYVAYASGGIFKTENNGISFKPVFDNYGTLTLGDIAISPSSPDVLFAGTGENNSSRSSYAGSGVYKSTDGGQSWEHSGLDNIQHTGRIIIHPENPDIVWVASMGALYSHNIERGVYKTSDGGKSWEKTLFVSDSTGIIDLVINPENPDQLWAAAWERTRSADHFKGHGPGSGIYRSDDGGESWKKLTAGLPEGEHLGRIGLAVAASQPNVVYAVLDNQFEQKTEKPVDESDALSTKELMSMDQEEFLKLDNEKLESFLRKKEYPEKYTAKRVKQEVKAGKYEPVALAEYFGDANAALFETSVTGAELYKSEDNGDSWEKVNEHTLDGVFFTYGYYFGEVRVAPDNADELYILGVPLIKSLDGGKTFTRIDTTGEVHVDHQTLWINPDDSEHVMLGNDGGLYISYDGGADWIHLNNAAVGQFYTVNVDMQKPYHVYGGLQDNGTLAGSSKSVPNKTEKWKRIMGGDGMYVAPDPRNPDIVFAGFQFGNYFRIDRSTDDYKYITPKHDIGEPKLRFNWRTPLIMSPHNPDILYIGAQKVYRTLNQGDSWEPISGDLTKDLPQGNVPHSTLTALSESPLKFGLLYAGSDDGNVYVSANGGADWNAISDGLPQNLWVSSLMASPHDEQTVFLSFTGYRYDDFTTYVYKSTDQGKNWTSLKGNLPDEAVNVIVQDPVNPNLLYVGTDHGTYISMDGGENWEYLYQIPNVASYDMIVHPRESELLIATHGRSIYKVDVQPMQEVAGTEEKLKVFDVPAVRYSSRWGKQRYPYTKANTPAAKLMYYVDKSEGPVKVEIFNSEEERVRILEADGTQGFHHISWDLQVTKYKGRKKPREVGERTYASKGVYTIRLSNGENSSETTVEIK